MAELKNWVSFDDNGLTVLSKPEIMEQLAIIDKEAFGADFVSTDTDSSVQGTTMGSAWYVHNELLAQSLASIGSAVKEIYDSINIISATGVNLDNRVVSAGITRETGETDAHLRYRYMVAVSTPSVSTSEGLIARLSNSVFYNADNELQTVNITGVNILENTTSDPIQSPDLNASTVSSLPGHSILVSIDGLQDIDLKSYISQDSSYNPSTTEKLNAEQYIATVIRNYKTLGCGTAGNISVTFSDVSSASTNKDIVINFSKVKHVNITINITFNYNASVILSDVASSIFNEIQTSVINYFSSFTIDKDVLYNDVLSIAQSVIMAKGYSNNDVYVEAISISADGKNTISNIGGRMQICGDEIVGLVTVERS